MQQQQKYILQTKGNDIYLIPPLNHTHTIIFLHGLGDSANEFSEMFTNDTCPTPITMKVVLLTADSRPVTINNERIMPSWYNFRDFNIERETFHETIGLGEAEQSYQQIAKVINQEIQILGGDSKKIFIGGMSQGGGMTLRAGLAFDKPLGGLIVICGFMFFDMQQHQSNAETPILIIHGTEDAVLPWEMVSKTFDQLDKKTHKIRLEIIEKLDHSINEQSLQIFKQYLCLI